MKRLCSMTSLMCGAVNTKVSAVKTRRKYYPLNRFWFVICQVFFGLLFRTCICLRYELNSDINLIDIVKREIILLNLLINNLYTHHLPLFFLIINRWSEHRHFQRMPNKMALLTQTKVLATISKVCKTCGSPTLRKHNYGLVKFEADTASQDRDYIHFNGYVSHRCLSTFKIRWINVGHFHSYNEGSEYQNYF